MNKIELATLEALTRSRWKLTLNQGLYLYSTKGDTLSMVKLDKALKLDCKTI